MSDPLVSLLRVDDALLAAHPDVYGAEPDARSVALANALSCGPAWERLRGHVRLVVRPSTGVLGLIGSPAPDDRPLLEAFGWQVESLLRRLRPVPYPEVESACIDLATRIRAILDDDALTRARVVGIPRGGMIVAAMLAYALGLPIAPSGSATGNEVTILVDDCSLSGMRLRDEIRRHRGDRLVIGLLHAHADLARAVEEREPGVVACIVARDLVDHALDRPDYEPWKERWQQRAPNDYWTGDPDHVCYPWNEPDALVWNRERMAAEAGWRVVPPQWCLKNRSQARVADVQVCAAVNGPLRPRDDVVWCVSEDEVIVAGRKGSTAIALRGSARAMWTAIVSHALAEQAIAEVAGRYGVDTRTVQADFERFTADLAARGLLHLE